MWMKALNTIDESRKYYIIGYIRKFAEKHQCTIPQLIYYCCLRYLLFSADYFVTCGRHMRIDNAEYGCLNRVMYITNNINKAPNTAYGNYTIDIDNTNISKYIWTLYVGELPKFAYLRIGIDSINRQWINHSFTKQYKFNQALSSWVDKFYAFAICSRPSVSTDRYEGKHLNEIDTQEDVGGFGETYFDEVKLIVDTESKTFSIVIDRFRAVMNDIKLSGSKYNLAVSWDIHERRIEKNDQDLDVLKIPDSQKLRIVDFEIIRGN